LSPIFTTRFIQSGRVHRNSVGRFYNGEGSPSSISQARDGMRFPDGRMLTVAAATSIERFNVWIQSAKGISGGNINDEVCTVSGDDALRGQIPVRDGSFIHHSFTPPAMIPLM
jgi:hypothetical protein